MQKMSWQENRKKEIEILLELIEKNFSIKKETLVSRCRDKSLVLARKLLMNVLFEVFENDKVTQGDISNIIGRDRTSFIHHRAKHIDEHNRYKNYKQEYDSFKKEYKELLKNNNENT